MGVGTGIAVGVGCCVGIGVGMTIVGRGSSGKTGGWVEQPAKVPRSKMWEKTRPINEKRRIPPLPDLNTEAAVLSLHSETWLDSLRFRDTRYFIADPTLGIQAIGEHNMGTLARGFPASRHI